MKIAIFSNPDNADKAGSAIIEMLIRSNPTVKLGLATGSSPVGIYQQFWGSE